MISTQASGGAQARARRRRRVVALRARRHGPRAAHVGGPGAGRARHRAPVVLPHVAAGRGPLGAPRALRGTFFRRPLLWPGRLSFAELRPVGWTPPRGGPGPMAELTSRPRRETDPPDAIDATRYETQAHGRQSMKKLFPLYPSSRSLAQSHRCARRHRPAGEYSKSPRQYFSLGLLARAPTAPPIDKITRTNTLLHLWRRLCVRLVPANEWALQIKPPGERQKAQGVQHGDGVPRRRQRTVGRPLF